jgi:hypothetical protein
MDAERRYRRKLREAERRGDQEFLDRELAKVQLTDAELARLASRGQRREEWYDVDDDPFAPRRIGANARNR